MSRGTAPKIGVPSPNQTGFPLPAPGLTVAEVMADVPHCQGKASPTPELPGALRKSTPTASGPYVSLLGTLEMPPLWVYSRKARLPPASKDCIEPPLPSLAPPPVSCCESAPQAGHRLPPSRPPWRPSCTPQQLRGGAHPDRPLGAPGLAHKEARGLAPLPTLDRVV